MNGQASMSKRATSLVPRRFKPYPAYKDSGVEWLGEIPAHWEVSRTKRVARLESGHTPSRQHSEYWQNCTIPWFSLADVWQIRKGTTEYVLESAEKVSELGLAHSAARLLPKGTVILSRTASVGFSAIMGVDMATTQDFVNWVCGPRLRPEYLLYVLRSMGQEFRRLTMGSTHQTIYMPDVGRFSTPVPPVGEQNRIVEFIRGETAKIDALVAKKERLIELLQEKRTALITRAVTRGLDPNVSMKDSGVEWLGEVPAHWEVKKLHHLLDASIPLSYGILLPGPHVDDGVPYVGAGDVLPDRLTIDTLPRTSHEIAAGYPRTRMRAGELVYAIRGSFGNVEAIPHELDGVNLSRDAARIAPNPTTNPYWLAFALRARSSRVQLDFTEIGATITGVNIRDLKRVCLAVPPQSEQLKLGEFLQSEASKIDALMKKVRAAIDYLKESRTALISAAVTGKIDVREELP